MPCTQRAACSVAVCLYVCNQRHVYCGRERATDSRYGGDLVQGTSPTGVYKSFNHDIKIRNHGCRSFNTWTWPFDRRNEESRLQVSPYQVSIFQCRLSIIEIAIFSSSSNPLTQNSRVRQPQHKVEGRIRINCIGIVTDRLRYHAENSTLYMYVEQQPLKFIFRL